MNFAADTTSGEEGVALFRRIRERHPDLPVILLTAWTSLDAAVDLIKAGAADYLAKPWDDQRLIASVTNLIELGQANRALRERLQRERAAQARARERSSTCAASCGAMPRPSACSQMACQVARSDLPVLITGPERRRQGAHRGDHPGQLERARRAVRDAQLRRACPRS